MAETLPRARATQQGVLPRTVTSHSPRFDFYGDSAALAAVWEALRADRRWDRLLLGHVPVDSPLVTELPVIARRHGCCMQASPSDEVPYFPLPGFEERLSPKFRTNVRRCMRKAGDIRLERHFHPSQKELDDALAIEAMAWKRQAGSSIDLDPRRRRFYRALMEVFGPRQTMSLNFATVDGQCIACLFTMEDGHTLFAAKIGYDPAFSAISPGHLMIALTAADAESRGLKVFDFLGTNEDGWKRKWTEQVRPHPWVTLLRPSLRGYSKVIWNKVRDRFGKRGTSAHPRQPALPERD
jgi:CelD/BcsL family acetyltransferase involved in cellulose biosynthesis